MRPRPLGCMYVQNCRRLELAVSYELGNPGADHLDTTGTLVKRGEAILRKTNRLGLIGSGTDDDLLQGSR